MLHSNKILAQQVVKACEINHVERLVVSPGSRNAPLIIEFNAFTSIEKYSLVDERSAAFFALGMAKETGKPVAVLCTSGSALLNYYPAIAEAYYSEIPLVVISADRPKELIDIGDGQAIRQEAVFKNHIKFTANLAEKDPASNYIKLKQVFSDLRKYSLPIHINVPFSEPLYETTRESLVDSKYLKDSLEKTNLLSETPLEVDALQLFADKWNEATKKMIVLGAHAPDALLQTQLNHLAKDPSVVILTENTSNVSNSSFIQTIDQVIFSFSNEDFKDYKPEILVTFGGLVISKKIKQLLRENPPKQHWHIDKNRELNTYFCLTHHFKVSIRLFFSQFFFLTKPKESSYQSKWLQLKKSSKTRHTAFMQKISFSDLHVFKILNQLIPETSNIQFSNSSIIRYAQLFLWSKEHKVACNRGASGIDGSTSTAIGAAVVSEEQTVFVTGDLSFFYDSNALWNAYIPDNFRIILINNGGGGIFRFIKGPATTQTLDFFETPHNLTANHLCDMHQVSYQSASNKDEFETILTGFFDISKKPKLVEVFTPKEKNALVLKDYFKYLTKE